MLHRGFPLAVLLLVLSAVIHPSAGELGGPAEAVSELTRTPNIAAATSPRAEGYSNDAKKTKKGSPNKWSDFFGAKLRKKSRTKSANKSPLEPDLPAPASSSGPTATPPHVTEDEAPQTRQEPPPTAHASGPSSSTEELPPGASDPGPGTSDKEAQIKADEEFARVLQESANEANYGVSADQTGRHSLEDQLLSETLHRSIQESTTQDDALIAEAIQESLKVAHVDPTQRKPIGSHTSRNGALPNPSVPRGTSPSKDAQRSPGQLSSPSGYTLGVVGEPQGRVDPQSDRRAHVPYRASPAPWEPSPSHTQVAQHSPGSLIQQNNLDQPLPALFKGLIAAYLVVLFFTKFYFPAK